MLDMLEKQQTEIEELSDLLREAEEENLDLKHRLEEQLILNETLNTQNRRLREQITELENLEK